MSEEKKNAPLVTQMVASPAADDTPQKPGEHEIYALDHDDGEETDEDEEKEGVPRGLPRGLPQGLPQERTFHISSRAGNMVHALRESEVMFCGLLKKSLIETEEEVNTTHAEPLEVSEISDTNFNIVMAYIKLCRSTGTEAPPIPKPLDTKKSLPEILGKDYVILEPHLNGKNQFEQFAFLTQLASDTVYFDMPTLTNKMCAAIAKAIAGVEVETIQQMAEYTVEARKTDARGR